MTFAMKNTYKLLLILLTMTICQVSCNKPDEYFRELMEEAESRSYPGGIDSVSLYNGFGQFALEIMIPPNNTAVKFALVKGLDTTYYDFPANKSLSSHRIVVKNVSDGRNDFELFTVNQSGNISPKKYYFNTNTLGKDFQLTNFAVKRGFKRGRIDFQNPDGNPIQKLALVKANADTLFLDVPLGISSQAIIVPDLQEGVHHYDLILVGYDGSHSNKIPISIDAYGPVYQSNLTTVGMRSYNYDSYYWDYYIYFSSVTSNPTIVGRKLRYQDYYETDMRVFSLKLTSTEMWLAYDTGGNYAVDGFYYWNEVLPENGIDVINSPEVYYY